MSDRIWSHIGVAAASLVVGVGIGSYATHYEGTHTREDVTVQMAEMQRDSAILPIAGSPVKGALNPKATIVVFTDFRAPATKKLYDDLMDKAFKVHGDKIALVYKAYPLSVNPDAVILAQAAAAAQRQNAFWPMAEALMHLGDSTLDKSNILALANKLGMDLGRFDADFDSPDVRDRIRGDIALGEKLGIKGAPAVFINGREVAFPNGMNEADLMSALNGEIARMDKLAAMPGFNYYVASLFDQPPADDAARPVREDAAESDRHFRNIKESQNIRGKQFGDRFKGANAGNVQKAEQGPIAVSQGISYAKGPDDAPVVLYVFSEFQCPFCGRAEPVIAELEKTYGSRLKIVFKNFPLAFHKDAKLASEAALAAGEQGKFWEMHDILFQNQKALGRESLSQYAAQLGLNMEQFNAALDSHKFASQVDLELKEGQDNGITGTPTFVINHKKIVGVQPVETFKAEIDAALK